ncbi:MAG: AAA family ATPase [Polyangiaceae bacterium]|nr:AAA family ATPase [Polyangiaceae bacterium]
MELTLPMVVVQHGRRLVEAWLPGFPSISATGPSLAEIRDDLALAVMERFYRDDVQRLGEYQIAPAARVEHVLVEQSIHDPERKQRWEVRGRVGVLVERWPGAGFLVVTPTRLPIPRFAVLNEDHLEASVIARVARWCRETDQRTLDPWHCRRRERLELLEVDAIAPTILPHTHPGARKLMARKKSEEPAKGEPQEPDEEDPDAPAPEPPTAQQAEEKRRIARLTAQVLRQVGRNLSHGAEDGNLGRAFGRDGLVDGLVNDLATREGAAVVLVGPPGVGKSAIVEEFCRRLLGHNRKHGLRRDVWRVDGNRFISGMMYVGQWEARARELIEELEETGDILFLDDLASMVQAGRTGKGDTNVAQFLGPAIARGTLTVVAESTPERLAWARQEEPGFVQLFRALPVPSMSMRASLPVLIGAVRGLEGESDGLRAPQRMTPSALESTLRLTQRFLPNEAFPGKAVRLLRATLDRVVDPSPARGGGLERRYGPAEVHATLQQRTGLPDFVLDPAQALPRDEIAARFRRLIAGQDEAVDAMTDLVLALQQGLCDPDKPLGTFLFVGPTGVGKTESARALARTLFGSPERLVRFDMSEFTAASSVTRLLGEPAAPDGELTSALRVQPFCVVLFDEIEKAHPRVFDALLQLLGEGRLSDAAGRLADARQAVLIMTSNLGVKEAASQVGFAASVDGARTHYISSAQRFFRPEFFNRIDRLVPFRSLDPEALRHVVEQQLAELLGRRGIARANLLVEVEPAMLDALVTRAYDPRFGARPLKREMERRLTVPLAHHLVRRRDQDLALIMLQRLGDTMALRVRTLRERTLPAAVPPVPDTTQACLAAFDELNDEVERFQEELLPLLQRPSGDEALDRARGGLLDAFRALRGLIQEAEADPILTEEFIEEEDDPVTKVRLMERTPSNPRRRFRSGLRPRPGYTLVRTHSTPGLTIHRAQTLLVPLLDRCELLAAQARSAASLERWTVLIEPAPGLPADDLRLDELARSLASVLPTLRHEVEQGHAWAPLPERSSAPPTQRRRLLLEGFALGSILASFSGFAVASGHLSKNLLLRVHTLPGSGEAVDALDLARKEALQRRSRGEDAPLPDVPDRVAFRHTQSWVHCLSGLPVSPEDGSARHRDLLAATLRLQRLGESLVTHGQKISYLRAQARPRGDGLGGGSPGAERVWPGRGERAGGSGAGAGGAPGAGPRGSEGDDGALAEDGAEAGGRDGAGAPAAAVHPGADALLGAGEAGGEQGAAEGGAADGGGGGAAAEAGDAAGDRRCERAGGVGGGVRAPRVLPGAAGAAEGGGVRGGGVAGDDDGGVAWPAGARGGREGEGGGGGRPAGPAEPLSAAAGRAGRGVPGAAPGGLHRAAGPGVPAGPGAEHAGGAGVRVEARGRAAAGAERRRQERAGAGAGGAGFGREEPAPRPRDLLDLGGADRGRDAVPGAVAGEAGADDPVAAHAARGAAHREPDRVSVELPRQLGAGRGGLPGARDRRGGAGGDPGGQRGGRGASGADPRVVPAGAAAAAPRPPRSRGGLARAAVGGAAGGPRPVAALRGAGAPHRDGHHRALLPAGAAAWVGGLAAARRGAGGGGRRERGAGGDPGRLRPPHRLPPEPGRPPGAHGPGGRAGRAAAPGRRPGRRPGAAARPGAHAEDRAGGPAEAPGQLPLAGPDRRGQDRERAGAHRVPLWRREAHGPHRHE